MLYLVPFRRLTAWVGERRLRQQMCKRCGRAQTEVDFMTSDAHWQSVVPTRWRGLALCLSCFEGLAAEQGRLIVKVFLVNGP